MARGLDVEEWTAALEAEARRLSARLDSAVLARIRVMLAGLRAAADKGDFAELRRFNRMVRDQIEFEPLPNRLDPGADAGAR